MGSQGQSPRQGLGAVAPRSAPAWMPGVYAKGLCKDAKPTKHTQPFTGERGLGIRQGCRDRTPKGFMQGRIQVVEQSRCRTHRQQTTTIAQMQSQPSIHSFSRGKGFRQGCRDRTLCGLCRTQSPQSVLKGIENSHYLIKTDFFYKLDRS